jgi:hypothetical protein
MADGATACGKLANGCTPCTSDAGCAAFGAGAFCSKKTGTACCTNVAVGQGFCSLPCPT